MQMTADLVRSCVIEPELPRIRVLGRTPEGFLVVETMDDKNDVAADRDSAEGSQK